MNQELEIRLETLSKEILENINDYIERINRGVRLIAHHQHTEIPKDRLQEVLLARALGFDKDNWYTYRERKAEIFLGRKIANYSTKMEIRANYLDQEYPYAHAVVQTGRDFLTNSPTLLTWREYIEIINARRARERKERLN